MINVSKPFLPPREEYNKYVDEIWDNGWLTNNGPLVNALELNLKKYLDLEHFLFLNNGTIALQIAIKALDLKGEIITTPFSYVATTNSIIWENCKPVFVDIDEETFNINPSLIDKAITAKTSAILATHVYGNPCDIEGIAKVADENNLKVIYDAAHCFGTKYKGRSVLQYGDISTISFHATKVFHTIEGGAVITQSAELTERLSKLRNFGHITPYDFLNAGINGKNSEFHAAMGLANLKYIDKILSIRKKQYEYYLKNLPGLHVQFHSLNPDAAINYSYFPIVFRSEDELLFTIEKLNHQYIYPRRYFYPSLNKLSYVERSTCPVAEEISKKVLCLPMFHDLSEATMELICRILLRSQNFKQW